MDELSLSLMSRQLAPPLNTGRYKGQAGRIGIFGGSLEYTGAPYFSAITALKVGADLVHVFCCKDAATVIKSYSPELIVHPLLDVEDAVNKIEPWLDRLHLLIIGPGLGREPSIFQVIEGIIEVGKRKQKPFVIDADGLFLISEKPSILNDFPSPGVIITPNVMEFNRIFGFESKPSIEDPNVKNRFDCWGNFVTVLRKGGEDTIMDYAKQISLSLGGSGRRCGGQGDILSGALGIFYAWALLHKLDVCVPHDDRAMIACYAACKLTRECNTIAFKKLGRSMVASDMIQEIHGVFEQYFEVK
ncbi:atp-dependent (s)-nad(p)h-hydrate dehydratase family member [Holotrichia oblita]|uniref:Atp-dependent (S)-nad(P)h-hydrate dehydratase family member n=2 Tax=Holotrichia oblita TaxID=644536 RepID=A0ACB9T6L5_HOLOL|nr:atp-dependent (s)-nad(p)h-hydrate dehydratase family member [Holotrichia oblita]KAI4462468.1 atp-dependent (s)-nad(p)h-hydrate dehydratase family member [Holotrichia oblita]